MADPVPRPPGLLVRTARALDVAALGLAVVTAAISFLLPPSGVGKCASYPSCLAAPPTAALAAHSTLGALLGLVILGLVLVAVPLRRRFPAALPRSLLAFVVVAVMGSIGAGLFTGALPTTFVIVQLGLLALLIALLVLALFALSEVPSSAEPVGPSAPATAAQPGSPDAVRRDC